MKMALVHDWFTAPGGAEKCVQSMLSIWDEVDIYSLVDFLEKEDKEIILKDKCVSTSFIQNLPFSKKHYRNYFPLFPFAIEQHDLSGYDLILSSSHSYAKGVLSHADQLHISYMYTPARYAWDLYYQYLRAEKLESGLKGLVAKYILHRLRMWDISTANRVDHYIAISETVADRIYKIYRRYSVVIYPPVDIEKYALHEEKEDYYIVVSRLVSYKQVKLIVEAFSKLGKRLLVIGDGPEMAAIKAVATNNIEILGVQPIGALVGYMQKAKALVFAAEDDFGIAPVEAQACGTPVICFAKGGARETVADGKTGVYFHDQTVQEIVEAVKRFEMIYDIFEPEIIRENALKFNKDRFEKEIEQFVSEKYQMFLNKKVR